MPKQTFETHKLWRQQQRLSRRLKRAIQENQRLRELAGLDDQDLQPLTARTHRKAQCDDYEQSHVHDCRPAV